MKNLILSLIALMAFNSHAHAAATAQSADLKKIVTQSVASDGDTYLDTVPEQESEASRIANATVAPKLETEARPKIWDARFFGRR